MSIFKKENLQAAYRKYKSMVYYDTYGSLNRKKIADFEERKKLHKNDSYFMRLEKRLSDEEERNKIFNFIRNSIDVQCYPKK